MNKYLIPTLGVILISLAFSVWYYKRQYENALLELGAVSNSLSVQNEAIKQRELELEAYTNKIDAINEKIESRYKDIKASHKNCEGELAEMKKILEVFYTRQ